MDLSWMAWTTPVAIFFLSIVCLIAAMGAWEYFQPGGGPRVGWLKFETTRGDRLFLSILSSGFITLGWIRWTDQSLWWALMLSVLWAVFLFRKC